MNSTENSIPRIIEDQPQLKGVSKRKICVQIRAILESAN